MTEATVSIRDIHELKSEAALDLNWDYTQSIYDLYETKSRPNIEHTFDRACDAWDYDISRIYY